MSQPPAANQVEEEHVALRRVIGSLTDAFQQDRPAGLAASIAVFAELLENHFATEEASEGLYEQVTQKDARFEAPIQQLRAEHGEMRRQARNLVGLAEIENWEAARNEFQSLSSTLSDHEHDENSLIQKAYGEDIGSKD